MPMPLSYQNASRQFRGFLDEVKERMDLGSDHMAYTAVDGVFQVFRRRLTVQQGLDFANVLPCVLTALFVKDWDVSAPPVPFADRSTMTDEVRQVRRHHNFAPDNAIEATARALRRQTDPTDLDRVLTRLPAPARAFWEAAEEHPSDAAPRR